MQIKIEVLFENQCNLLRAYIMEFDTTSINVQYREQLINVQHQRSAKATGIRRRITLCWASDFLIEDGQAKRMEKLTVDSNWWKRITLGVHWTFFWSSLYRPDCIRHYRFILNDTKKYFLEKRKLLTAE